MKPVVSCSPNSNITLPFEDYIGAIIPKCDEGAKKRTNEVLVETYRQAALPLNCHNPRKKQEGKKEVIPTLKPPAAYPDCHGLSTNMDFWFHCHLF